MVLHLLATVSWWSWSITVIDDGRNNGAAIKHSNRSSRCQSNLLPLSLLYCRPYFTHFKLSRNKCSIENTTSVCETHPCLLTSLWVKQWGLSVTVFTLTVHGCSSASCVHSDMVTNLSGCYAAWEHSNTCIAQHIELPQIYQDHASCYWICDLQHVCVLFLISCGTSKVHEVMLWVFVWGASASNHTYCIYHTINRSHEQRQRLFRTCVDWHQRPERRRQASPPSFCGPGKPWNLCRYNGNVSETHSALVQYWIKCGCGLVGEWGECSKMPKV